MDEKITTFYELYERRKSIREFGDSGIESEKLDRILETVRRAQSAANCQPWHFIILKEEGRDSFNHLLTRDGFKNAPLIIVACAEPAKAWVRKNDNKNYAWVDVTIAVTEMISAATAEGLGTCWIAAFDPAAVKTVLDIPHDIEPVGLIAMGYPKTPLKKEDKNRKPLEDILHYDKW